MILRRFILIAVVGSVSVLQVQGADTAPAAAPKKRTPASSVTVNRSAKDIQAAKNVKKEPLVTKQENMDRMVDEMAVGARETAILNLKRMLRLKRGTSEESMLLWRLAEMEWRATKNHFRVGVSKGDQAESNVRYDELLKAVVAHTSEILERFPKFKGVRETLMLRGKAYEELKKKDLALVDYMNYIAKYPNEKQTVAVRLMASDVLADQNRHADILKVLAPVNVNTNLDGMEGQVVQHQAMANFNLDNHGEALRKAEWLLKYDERKQLQNERGSHYDEVISLIALFYGTAFDKRQGGYALEHASDYFRRLGGGHIFGRLSHEFILVMRSKEMHDDVLQWKTIVVKKMPKSFDTLTTLVDTYDAVIAWKEYKHLEYVEHDFYNFFNGNPAFLAKAQTEDNFRRFKKTLLEFADKLYETLPKKDIQPSDFAAIQGPYLKALSTFMRITDPKDETKARVRFRMGEFYAGVRDWDKAQAAFTDVYQAKLFPVPSKEFRDQARMRAITARYDSFKDKGIIPQELKAVALSSPKRPIPGEVVEWIKWVDEVASQDTTQKETMDKLVFEANRLVYSYGDINTAYKRMLNYVGTRPDSKLTGATAALVIDTLIESEAWVATRTLAIKFQKMPNIAVGEFKTKLVQLERDSHYKITEGFFKTKEYAKVISFGEEHIKLYPETKRKIDLIAMMGKASMELKDNEASLKYMGQIIELAPSHESIGAAYFVRAQDHEKHFRLKEAFDDYSRVIKMPPERRGLGEKDIPKLKRKLLLIGWASGDEASQKKIISNDEFCGGGRGTDAELQLDCAKLEALWSLYEADKRTAWQLVEQGDRAHKTVRSIWYASALIKGNQLPNSVIQRTLGEFTKYWDQLDGLNQMQVLVSLNESVPVLIAKKRETIERVSQIDHRVDRLKQTLEKRVREVKGLENLAAGLLTLPAMECKLAILTELGEAYGNIAKDLDKYPMPKGFKKEEIDAFKQALGQMVQPLRLKVAALGGQAWAIAKQYGLKTPWVDEQTQNQMGDEYASNPVKWTESKGLISGLTDAGKQSSWLKAVQGKKVSALAFLYQLAQSPEAARIGVEVGDIALLSVASLDAMGLESMVDSSAAARLKTLTGEPERLLYMARLHRAVISQNYEGIKAIRLAMNQHSLSDENSEESTVYKLAEKFEMKFGEMIAQAEAAKKKADEDAAREASEKAKQQKKQSDQAAQDKAAPKKDKRKPASDEAQASAGGKE